MGTKQGFEEFAKLAKIGKKCGSKWRQKNIKKIGVLEVLCKKLWEKISL